MRKIYCQNMSDQDICGWPEHAWLVMALVAVEHQAVVTRDFSQRHLVQLAHAGAQARAARVTRH